MKESVILYNSLGKVLKAISAEQCQRLMMAIFDFNETGIRADLSDDPVLNAVWIIQADQIQRDSEKYEKRVQSGKSGGRPKKTTEKVSKTIGKPLVSDTDTETDTDTVTDTVTDSVSDTVVENHGFSTGGSAESQDSDFEIPSRKEVMLFCKQNGFTFSPEKFYKCYQKSEWTANGERIRNWKALAYAWQQRELERPPKSEKDMPDYMNPDLNFDDLPF